MRIDTQVHVSWTWPSPPARQSPLFQAALLKSNSGLPWQGELVGAGTGGLEPQPAKPSTPSVAPDVFSA